MCFTTETARRFSATRTGSARQLLAPARVFEANRARKLRNRAASKDERFSRCIVEIERTVAMRSETNHDGRHGTATPRTRVYNARLRLDRLLLLTYGTPDLPDDTLHLVANCLHAIADV